MTAVCTLGIYIWPYGLDFIVETCHIICALGDLSSLHGYWMLNAKNKLLLQTCAICSEFCYDFMLWTITKRQHLFLHHGVIICSPDTVFARVFQPFVGRHVLACGININSALGQMQVCCCSCTLRVFWCKLTEV